MHSLFTQFRGDFGWSMLALAVTSCSAGCSRADRWDLSGKVTYGGKPVAEGHIAFDPIQPGAGGGFAHILEGQYDTRHEGRNHPGGVHRITVVGYKGLANPKNPDSDVVQLFPAYEVEVELPTKKSTLDFDVPADWGRGANKSPSKR